MSSPSRSAGADTPSRVRELATLGQSIWLDSISRDLMDSGKLDHLIHIVGIRGMTSNPTIFEKAINGSASYDGEIAFLSRRGYNAQQILRVLMVRDIRRACDFFRPVHQETGGTDGFVSIEVNPLLAHKTEETIAEARLLYRLVDRPNLMVKVPGTPEGMPAIEALTAIGMSINVTLLFSPRAYQEAAEAYIRGLEVFVAGGGNPSRVHSVASVFVSRIDTLVDKKIQGLQAQGGDVQKSAEALLGRAGIENSRIIYGIFQDLFHSSRFSEMLGKGGHVQRPLWASTGTKNPAYSDVLYIDSLIAPETVNTVPESTLNFYLDHGSTQVAIDPSPQSSAPDPRETFRRLEALGIRMDDVFGQLVTEGVKAFDQSFVTLTGVLEEKARSLTGTPDKSFAVTFGEGKLEAGTADRKTAWQRERLFERLLEEDGSLYPGDPRSNAKAMGFLSDAERLLKRREEFLSIAEEIRTKEVRTVLWLGMGGSILSSFALSESFPDARVRLLGADTTDPETLVRLAEDAGLGGEGGPPPSLRIVVASQSGSTLEVSSLYAYVRALLEKKGVSGPGKYFWALTDPGSPLDTLAASEKFGRIIHGTPGIPGRFSALSVPVFLAASVLTGAKGLELAFNASRSALSDLEKAGYDGRGVQLGTLLAAAGRSGRDKVLLSGPPMLCGWFEQLLAEGTGKAGTGWVPAGHGNADVRESGEKTFDRLFVEIGFPESPDMEALSRISHFESTGESCFSMTVKSPEDIYSFFLDAMMGVAMAAYDRGVNPFEAPDVGLSKEKTREILERFSLVGGRVWEEPLPKTFRKPVFEKEDIALFAEGFSPSKGGSGDVSDAVSLLLEGLLQARKKSPYLVLQSWLPVYGSFEDRLMDWGKVLSRKFSLPVMVVRGPAFLHMVGQVFKGGPDEGLFLQLSAKDMTDLPIPGKPYGFATLFRSQQLGDFLAMAQLGRPVGEIRFAGRPEAERFLDGVLKK